MSREHISFVLTSFFLGLALWLPLTVGARFPARELRFAWGMALASSTLFACIAVAVFSDVIGPNTGTTLGIGVVAVAAQTAAIRSAVGESLNALFLRATSIALSLMLVLEPLNLSPVPPVWARIVVGAAGLPAAVLGARAYLRLGR